MPTAESAKDIDVFLSYAREDKKVARRLVEALVSQRGWSVWWDIRLRTGEQFSREIQRLIRNTRCVMVLWSKHSSESDWVIAEASEGWERGVLVPVLIDECEPPMPFRQTHATNLSGWGGSTSASEFLLLLEDIQRTVARGSAVSPVEIQARERRRKRMLWQRMLRVAWPVALASLVLLGAGLLFRQSDNARKADAIATRSESIRDELLQEFRDSKRSWRAFLSEDRNNRKKLMAGALFAIEAYKTARTPRTHAALNDTWRLLPWTDRQIQFGGDEALSNLKYSYDGRYLAAGGGYKGSVILDANSHAVLARIPYGGLSSSNKPPSQFDARDQGALEFSPAQNVLATAGPDNTVRLWNERGEELKRFDHGAEVTAVQFDSTGRLLVAADKSGEMVLWDLKSGNTVQRLKHSGRLTRPVISKSGAYIGAVSGRRDAVVWRRSTGEIIAEIEHNPGWGSSSVPGFSLRGIAFTPDERAVVTWGYQRSTVVHDLETGEPIWQIEEGSFGGPIFIKDGSVMIHSGDDLTWWDMKTRKLEYSIPDADVVDIVRGPGGKWMGTVDALATAKIWDVLQRNEIKRVPYYRFRTALAFSPDGSTVAFSGYDERLARRVIEFLKFRPENLVEKICSYFGTDLSPAEWRVYFSGLPYVASCPNLVEH